MSLSEQEKRELAEVFMVALNVWKQELYTQIASGFVEIANGMMDDLAAIVASRNKEVAKEIIAARKQMINDSRAGFM